MKNLRKLPTKQLEKFSTVFMQLGLVLVLFIVYTLLEHQTETRVAIYEPPLDSKNFYLPDDVQNVIIKKEVKVKPKPKVAPPKVVFLENVTKGDDTMIETIIPDITTDNDIPMIDLSNFEEVDIPEDIGPETVPFLLIEDAPVFKGCEGLSKKENRICFENNMRKFIQRNFNASLAQDLGLRSGKHKMYSQFVINKDGKIIDIVVKAPHKRLEKEAQRIIKILPQFTPGMQRKKPVKVKYTLPIAFLVE